MDLWFSWGSGLMMGFALIMAIGPQNAFVLRQGVRREHVGAVVLICMVSDAVMITAGTAGIDLLVAGAPGSVQAIRWIGAVYMVGCAAVFLAAAVRPAEPAAPAVTTRRSVMAAAVALTYLNPSMYLDTVVLLGTLANERGPGDRWYFASGAITSSLVWFTALGFGARALSVVLVKPCARRLLDAGTAAVMLVFAVRLIPA